ncbi:MAG: tyrosine-type recombinase/integrase [Sulfurimonas sp.]|uniref:tyrosine-type recombinase/integrase n=1 Tax=Sulfurimonas sp. TaxID=2022749 RepID=UPI0025F88A1A|nr:tyrosine-type recombinase/integrase [Sulfurimonas sp.]MCK9491921.1 tyrosine-type recombinase/integrase [Sulfurimonas sp.]
MRTDEEGNIISSKNRYRVSPSLPSETEEDAIKKEIELNSISSHEVNSNINLKTPNVWNEIWENLDDYLKEFLDEIQKQRRLTDNTIKNMNSGFQYLRLFCKKDTIPNLKFYKNVQNSLEMIPRDFLRSKKWEKFSVEDIEKNFDNCDYETMNSKTINKHINFHKQFFSWLEYNNDIYKTNMNKLIPLFEEDEVVKVEYSEEDLKAIFEYDLNSEYRDFFNIALHTGMRMGEICSLKNSNINEDYIEIFDGKTKNATRIIPLHKNIKEMVINRAKSNNEYLLFNGNSSAVNKKLNRLLNKIILNKTKSLHSFRKNFSQMLEQTDTGEEKYKDYLMGHSIASVRQKHYNLGKINIDKLREIINSISPFYHPLVISS